MPATAAPVAATGGERPEQLPAGSVEVELTIDHWEAAGAHVGDRMMKGVRRGSFGFVIVSLAGAGAGAAFVAAFMGFERVWEGASLVDGGRWAAGVLLQTAAILGPLAIVALAFKERQIRAARRETRDGIGAQFDLPHLLRMTWGEGRLDWTLGETAAGKNFAAMHAWEEADGLLILYVQELEYLAVPIALLAPETADNLRAALVESGLRTPWAPADPPDPELEEQAAIFA